MTTVLQGTLLEAIAKFSSKCYENQYYKHVIFYRFLIFWNELPFLKENWLLENGTDQKEYKVHLFVIMCYFLPRCAWLRVFGGGGVGVIGGGGGGYRQTILERTVYPARDCVLAVTTFHMKHIPELKISMKSFQFHPQWIRKQQKMLRE